MTQHPFSLTKRLQSFVHATNGIKQSFVSQHNFWLHGIATIAVIIFGFIFHVTPPEFCGIIFAIALVWITEMINTAIETFCNYVQPDIHPAIKIVKDIAAGAVLLAAITAVIIASIIFIPKFL